MTVRKHNSNSKIFEYKGKPLVLLCATEHYGAVMNRPFDYKKYILECCDKKQNYTRLFLLFRELQCADNPYSTCKPESPDYIAPYKRTGPGLACDGLPKYDLNEWNDEFFTRLHEFMRLCEENDIIVEVTLFSDSYSQHLFELLPVCSENNINGLPHVDFRQVMSRQVPELFSVQEKYVKKIITELNRYPNFFYEICNEPAAFNPVTVTPSEMNDWQDKIIEVIRREEKNMKNVHMIAAEECWLFDPEDAANKHVICPTEYMFGGMDIDIVNIHPHPRYLFSGNTYDLGLFMSKQLRIEGLKRFCMNTYHKDRVLSIDEDNIASLFKDYEGWTIHRKRAWTAVMCGAHYDYIDFSILWNSPRGTEESRSRIRTWFKYLQEYIAGIDIVSCRPLSDVIIDKPDHVTDCVLGKEGADYHIYLADNRELYEEGFGSTLSGSVTVNIPAGKYIVTFFAPEFGKSISRNSVILPKNFIELPEFTHDLVVTVEKKG